MVATTPKPALMSYAQVFELIDELTVEQAFDRLLPLPLPALFSSWYGPIPPIRETRQEGVWGVVGQQREVVFVGPGSARERLLEVTRPEVFGYELTGLTGPLALLATRVEGRWAFDPEPGGVRITWSWAVHPRWAPAGLLLPVFGRLWGGYARAAFARLPDLLRTAG